MKRLAALLMLSLTACGKGPAGPQGLQGIQGATGLTGAPGESASIEVIELCPEISGSAFNEYLLRIDGALFGVYAQGQRIFLTRLVPGNYRTTDGRQCNFTVSSDLQVSFN